MRKKDVLEFLENIVHGNQEYLVHHNVSDSETIVVAEEDMKIVLFKVFPHKRTEVGMIDFEELYPDE